LGPGAGVPAPGGGADRPAGRGGAVERRSVGVRRDRRRQPRLRNGWSPARGQPAALGLCQEGRAGNRPVPAVSIRQGRLRALPAGDRAAARPGDGRDGAGPRPRSREPGLHDAEPDRRGRLERLGPGARALLCTYLGRCLPAAPRHGRPRRAGAPRQPPRRPARGRPLRLYRPRPLPPAPGRRSRRLPPVRQSSGTGEGGAGGEALGAALGAPPKERSEAKLSRSERSRWVAAARPAPLLLARAAYLDRPFRLIDDAFISFRYAANLAAGKRLVWNPGERVEGYTNFLWTLLLAAGARAGLDLVVLSKLLAAAAGVGTVFLLTRLAASLPAEEEQGSSLLQIALPPFLFAAMGSQARYIVSVLETLLFVFLLVLALDLLFLRGRPALAGAVFAAAAMTRPEGVLYALLAGACFLSWGAQAPRPWAR